jgi:hypothetical protein
MGAIGHAGVVPVVTEWATGPAGRLSIGEQLITRGLVAAGSAVASEHCPDLSRRNANYLQIRDSMPPSTTRPSERLSGLPHRGVMPELRAVVHRLLADWTWSAREPELCTRAGS